MTNPQHASGTDRCAEVARLLNLAETAIIVNIQGDEPFIRKDEINLLIKQFDNQNIQIATLAKPISTEEELNNPNKVKVVFTNSNKALYFSRFPIPHSLLVAEPVEASNLKSHKHLGIYAYKNHILQQITKLPVSSLEETEKLEQLRWLENDFTIHISICHHESIAIDTPDDLRNYESGITN